MLYDWKGNCGPGGQIAAFNGVHDYVTCGLTGWTGTSSGPNARI